METKDLTLFNMHLAPNALVIWHKDCMDGFGAAYAFYKYGEFNYQHTTYHKGVYGEDIFEASMYKDTDVYIVDFSYDPETTIKIASFANHVYVLDHHKTAAEAWEKYYAQFPILTPPEEITPENLTIKFDMNRSGAVITFEFLVDTFHIENMHLGDTYLFNFIQDRDLWKFENEDTKAFHAYMSLQEKNFYTWNQVAHLLAHATGYDEIIHAGKVLLEQWKDICEKLAEAARPVIVHGVRGLEVNVPGMFASDVGHILANRSLTFGHTWELLEDRSKHSLRSYGDIDVSKWAKEFGGGGHKNAAGFTLKGFHKDEDKSAILKFESIFRKPEYWE